MYVCHSYIVQHQCGFLRHSVELVYLYKNVLFLLDRLSATS